MRSAHFGPWDRPGSGGAASVATAATMAGFPWGAALQGGGAAMGGLAGILGANAAEEEAKRNRELTREEMLIQLMQRDADTRQRNNALDAITPIKQELLTRVLGGKPGGLETAAAMPRTYQSSGPPGTPSLTPPTQTPGQPDFLGRATQQTQYGAPADPAALQALVPNFSERRKQQFQDVQALTSKITADAFKGEEIIPKLNDYEQTRGAYTWSDQDPTKASGKEVMEQAASDPQGKVQGQFRNEENDQLDDVEVGILNEMIRNLEPVSKVAAKYQEFLTTRLDGGR